MTHSAIIVSDKSALAEHIMKAVTPAFANVTIKPSSKLASEQASASVYIIDAACVDDARLSLLRSLTKKSRVILVSESDVEQIIALMVVAPEINHIFGSFSDKNASLLLTTIRHSLGLLPTSVSSYVDKTTSIKTATLSKYSEASAVIGAIRALAVDTGAFSELPNIVATVTSEMIMNACFDAPLDKTTGKAKYAHLSRTHDLILNESERVTIKYGFDRENFLVSVTDNFGALDRKTVVDNLERCAKRGADQIRHSSGGAGVGLYMLFRYSSQLDFHVVPGQRTEVVALVSLGKRLREYEMSGPCINFFVRDRV